MLFNSSCLDQRVSFKAAASYSIWFYGILIRKLLELVKQQTSYQSTIFSLVERLLWLNPALDDFVFGKVQTLLLTAILLSCHKSFHFVTDISHQLYFLIYNHLSNRNFFRFD